MAYLLIQSLPQVSVIHKRPVLSDIVIGKGIITSAELGENGPVEVKLAEPKSATPAGILRFSVSGNHNLGCKLSSSTVPACWLASCLAKPALLPIGTSPVSTVHMTGCDSIPDFCICCFQDPKTATIKGSTGDAPGFVPATAGFSGRSCLAAQVYFNSWLLHCQRI